MTLEAKNLTEIHPYPGNPRKNDNAVESVAESIRQCGYVAPIIVDEEGVILAGHTRYKALQKVGYTKAQVIVKEGLTKEQKKKYRLLDNKTNELASWDFELLAQELEGLDFGSLHLDWGIQNEPTVVEDNYEPELPESPKSKAGDVYQLGSHRLMCGDSTSLDDVKSSLVGRKWTCFSQTLRTMSITAEKQEKLKTTTWMMISSESFFGWLSFLQRK